MAARKTAVDTPDQPAAYNLGLSLEDMKMPRLRVVGRQAKAVELDIAKAGDLMIGADAEDEESQIVKALNAKETLRVHILKIHANYACKFGGPQGQWEEGDPEMPADAKRQYNLTLFVPDHSEILPVTYTASGSAAGVVRKVITKLQVAGLGGHPPYEFAYDVSTVINTSGTNSWPGPVFSLAEADADHVAAAQAMHDSVVAPPRAALASGDDSDKPSL
jgi:hypothetical protein